MTWAAAPGFVRRPLVVVEDHLHHVGELLASITGADPSLLALTTVVCLDRAGIGVHAGDRLRVTATALAKRYR